MSIVLYAVGMILAHTLMKYYGHYNRPVPTVLRWVFVLFWPLMAMTMLIFSLIGGDEAEP